jgi:hypothetical protein
VAAAGAAGCTTGVGATAAAAAAAAATAAATESTVGVTATALGLEAGSAEEMAAVGDGVITKGATCCKGAVGSVGAGVAAVGAREGVSVSESELRPAMAGRTDDETP